MFLDNYIKFTKQMYHITQYPHIHCDNFNKTLSVNYAKIKIITFIVY